MMATNTIPRNFAISAMLCVLLAAAALASAPTIVRADAAPAREYAVKAAFLFNFTKFVEWPPEAFPDAKAPILIGVLGDDPFGQILEDTVQGATAQNRSVIIKRSHAVADLKMCQVVFIAKSERSRAPQILAALGKASMLTVGEHEGFAQHGGMINFFIEDGRVRFEINPESAKRGNLKISTKLLRLGRIVQTESD